MSLSDAPGQPEPAEQDPTRLLLQEYLETAQRSRLGGLFYAAAWALVVAMDGIAARYPLLSVLAGAAFVALALIRFRPPSQPTPDPARIRRGLARLWGLILATALAWGGVSCWVVALPAADAARSVALMSSIAFATAIAHTFCMRPRLAALAIALIYLPGLVALWLLPSTIGLALAMAIYLIYVGLALLRSHREYRERLGLEAQLRCQRDRFEQQSRRDGLTGLANRRRFEDELSALVANARSRRESFSLLILDLDHFKQVNDRFGHAAGDACLVSFADRLRHGFAGPGELAARLGGEEFAVLLPATGIHEAVLRAEALRASLATTPLELGEGAITLTVSIGVGSFDPASTDDGTRLLRAADSALYQAKDSGRDAVRAAANPGDG